MVCFRFRFNRFIDALLKSEPKTPLCDEKLNGIDFKLLSLENERKSMNKNLSLIFAGYFSDQQNLIPEK